MKFSIILDGNDPKELLKSLVISYNGLIQTDESNKLVAIFCSRNWEIGQIVSFEWSSEDKSSRLKVDSKLTPLNQKTLDMMIKVCVIALPALAITCLFNVINVLYQLLLTTLLASWAILIGVTFFLHGRAVERLVRYLAFEFEKRKIKWRLESDETTDELKPLMIVAIVFALLMVAVLVSRSVISVLFLLFCLGLFLIIFSGKRHTYSGMSLWKASLSNIFMYLALLASFPLIYQIALSLFIYHAPDSAPFITVLFGLLVLFFAGIVLPDSLNTQEKIFGKSFWVGARIEYQKVLEETRDEIHTREYFGKWLGLNLMVFPCIAAAYANFWYILPEKAGILFMGFLFSLKIVILFPLFILMFSWIERSVRNLFLYTQMKEPTSRTHKMAVQIFQELCIRNAQVKSYESSFINGGAVYPSPFSNRGLILISSRAEKKLSDTELECLILHECGHIANDGFVMRLLKFISQFSPLGEALFALSVDMVRVEERSDLFAARKVGRDAYSRFLLRVSAMNTLMNMKLGGLLFVYCFLPPFLPEGVKSKGLRGLYEMYKDIYSMFFGGGIVGYLHPSIPRRIKNISSIEIP